MKAAALLSAFVLLLGAGGGSAAAREAWVASWAAAPQAADPDPKEPLTRLDGQTVRERVRLSVGGLKLRVQLTNAFGTTPLTVGAATVALPTVAPSVQTQSLKALAFRGKPSVTILPGQALTSDPVEFTAPPGAELSISLYFPGRVATPTIHALALKRAIVSPRGDFTTATRLDIAARTESQVALAAVLVPAAGRPHLVAAFGDSITDGDGSTVDGDATWVAALSRREPTLAIVNLGIAGGQLMHDLIGPSGLSRLDRDVLQLPGVTHVVVEMGLNDLGFPGARLGGQELAPADRPRTAADLIAAYRQVIARAHAKGLKVIGVTLGPFEGVKLPGYYTAAKEAERQSANAWIRAPGDFDGIIDLDAVLRDPDHPERLNPALDSGDHLHPNDAGYQDLADAIDLGLFR
jgi:lysophospholipase L1-like esterase